ncbi:nucleotidyltransferase domain-containing protein [Cohnella sp. GCM10027633]|uniref:nucleotidyltransferase domain-containing protein n=1 Tax=unclassified Cohnella TaxID=2636738 RepID=UPI00364399D7
MIIINASELVQVELLMKSFQRSWFIAGGWTIDLAVNEITRTHKDMDICIFREDVPYVITYFSEWDIQVAIPGEHRLEAFKNLSDLDPPRYCLHLFKGNEFLEILVTERIEEKVIFRKNRSIKMDIYDFAKGNHTRPYVNPVWQLLFKSLSTREEDEHDFKIYMDRVNDDSSKKWLLQNIIEAKGNKNWISKLESYFREGGNIL